MEKVAILFNPSSGKGRAGQKRRTLEKCLKEQGVTYDWFNSRSEDDLRDLVEATAENYPTLIAAGGDTTFLIVINEMLRLGLGNTLGMIGLGSCNDVVREFEIHSLKKACLAIKRNRSRRIDLGMALDGEKVLRYYPGQASIGLAVLINQYVERVVKRSPRLGKYQTLSGLRGGWQALRSVDLRIYSGSIQQYPLLRSRENGHTAGAHRRRLAGCLPGQKMFFLTFGLYHFFYAPRRLR
jgi:diacylglycerol kinase family enzyme